MKDIIVSGLGVLSPAGITVEEYWNTLNTGKMVYGTLDEIADDPNYRIKIGAKVKDDRWTKNVPPFMLKQYGKASCYTISTALKAINDAGLDMLQIDAARIAIVIGTTMGEIETEERLTRQRCSGETYDNAMLAQYPTYNIVNGLRELIGGMYCYVLPAACAAGNYAVSVAKKLLEWNYVDIAIVGGVDVFSLVAFSGFQRLLSLTPDVCRPFDKNRRGLVLGEGCGIVILEREGERQKQKSYGKILGTGLASNAYHMTAPHIHGDAEMSVMRLAMEEAGLDVKDIDYISAHGTGTKLNDKTEIKAVKRLFQEEVPPISSIKSMIGHSMGAASILELIASLLMIKHGTILPTINHNTLDEECDVDIVANQSVKKQLNYVLSNSYAFGGQTSSILIGA